MKERLTDIPSGPHRWREQRWLIDNVIRTVGM